MNRESPIIETGTTWERDGNGNSMEWPCIIVTYPTGRAEVLSAWPGHLDGWPAEYIEAAQRSMDEWGGTTPTGGTA